MSPSLSNTRIVLVGDHCSFVKRYMSSTSSLLMYSSTAIPLQESMERRVRHNEIL